MIGVKDLMVGDLVYHKTQRLDDEHEHFVSVTDILYINEDAISAWDNFEFSKECRPIPLLDSIITLNGFKDMGDNPYYKWYNEEIKLGMVASDGELILTLDGKEKLSLVYDGLYYTVHELQHALKLIGLNDFANNFKAL